MNGLRAHRTQESSDPRHFGTSAEMSGHFGLMVRTALLRLRGNIAETVHSLQILRNARIASNAGACIALLAMRDLRKI